MMKKLKASFYWVRALGAAAEENYSIALEHIERIERLLPIKGEVRLFKGYLCYAVGDFDRAVDYLLEACADIDESQRYSDHDKKYMKCYASVWGLRSIEKTGGSESSRFLIDYSSIDLDKVSSALKNNFPLRSHPGWLSS